MSAPLTNDPYLNELLRDPEAAKEIGCKASTLPKWRQRGVGPRYVKQAKFVRYRRGDILDWIASSTTPLKREGRP